MKHLDLNPNRTWTIIRSGINAEKYIAKNLKTGEEMPVRDSYEAAKADIPTGKNMFEAGIGWYPSHLRSVDVDHETRVVEGYSGQEIVLKLQETAASGYLWTLTQGEEVILTEGVWNPDVKLIGGHVVHWFNAKFPSAKHTKILIFSLARPWEIDKVERVRSVIMNTLTDRRKM